MSEVVTAGLRLELWLGALRMVEVLWPGTLG